LGWIVIWIGLASGVERVNLRYLLPIAPLLGVLAASAWRQVNPARLAQASRPGWRLATLALAATSLASFAVVAYSGRLGTALLLMFSAAALIAVIVSLGREADALRLAALGVTCTFAMLAIASLGLMRMRMPDIGWSIAQELHRAAELAGRPAHAVFVGEPGVAARARVYSRGELELRQMSKLHPATWQNADLVLLSRDDEALSEQWIRVGSLTNGFRAIHAPDLLRAALDGQLEPYLKAHRQQITMVAPRNVACLPPQQIARHDGDSPAPDVASIR
jgi:hypothetical protein